MSARNRKSAKGNKKIWISLIAIVIVVIIGLSQGTELGDIIEVLLGDGTVSSTAPTEPLPQSNEPDDNLQSTPADNTQTDDSSTPLQGNSGDLQVYFLDVGQADCSVLLLPNGKVMVIDAGNNSDGKLIASYLKELDVKRIDYLIGTHPHEDHIGGMDDLIESFAIGKIYMPQVADKQIPTTATYTDVLEAVVAKKRKVNTGKAGMTILDENDLKITFIAPTAKEYEDLNSYSIVVKVEYGRRSFLFMGDAETDSEELILEKGTDVSADVLKLGHHGSSTSSGKKFMNAVNPATVIISCGKNNDYGHPHREILQMIKDRNLRSYRTDQDGTIYLTCDGEKLKWKTLDVDCNGNSD